MTLRSGHGKGAGQPRIEVLPLDELPQVNAEETAANLAIRKRRGKPFTKGNRAAAGRPPALAQLGVPLATTDPLYRKLMGQAARYRRKRVSELTAMYGYVSAGAVGLLATSALAMAGSRYCYAKAAETEKSQGSCRFT